MKGQALVRPSLIERKHKKLRDGSRVPIQGGRSSRERGRLFRARRKGQEQALLNAIVTLRDEIAAWDMRRSMCEAKYFQQDGNFTGSLEKLINEYATLFVNGFMRIPADLSAHDRCIQREHVRDHARRQEEFLKCVMDPNVVVGDVVGVDALMNQWHLYTSAHASFTEKVTMVEVINGNDCPMVMMHSQLYGRITPSTFRIMFPNAFHYGMDKQLFCELMNRPVTYNCLTRFYFTEHGKISAEHFDVDFASALLSVPCLTPEMVVSLLEHSTISIYSTVKENMPVEALEKQVDEMISNSDQDEVEKGTLLKMSLRYVLSNTSTT